MEGIRPADKSFPQIWRFSVWTRTNSRIIIYQQSKDPCGDGFCGSAANGPQGRLLALYAAVLHIQAGAVRWDAAGSRSARLLLPHPGLTFTRAAALDQLYFHVNAYAADGCDLLSRLTAAGASGSRGELPIFSYAIAARTRARSG